MATIVNTPAHTHEGSNGAGFLLGVILLLVLALLFFFYGLPALTNSVSNQGVSVPEQVDVNVNTPNK